MSKKNLLSGRDKELQELAEQYEAAKAENKPIYLDADDLADLCAWKTTRCVRLCLLGRYLSGLLADCT